MTFYILLFQFQAKVFRFRQEKVFNFNVNKYFFENEIFSSYLLIVVSAVAGAADDAGPLLGVGPDEVDLGVVEDLVVLVRRELVHVELHDLVGGGHHRLRLQQRGVGAWVERVRASTWPGP